MSGQFPFTAILGHEAMQTALLVNAVDPTIGGVLVRGQKGTAKSTAARALAGLLPPITVVAGCPYHCDPAAPETLHAACRDRLESEAALPRETIPTPFVDLPLAATEDRLVGTLHLSRTLQSGARSFEPGLLAAAHRGILYVDEVNLLADHLVDLLLDSAATGVNLVEREGLQFRHAARYLLIGTMNPEEGELRPQFLDRFGLCVSIAGLNDPAQRRAIVTRRLAYDSDPEAFRKDYAARQELLRAQVAGARARLHDVQLTEALIDGAVTLATAAGAQGHRAELALVRGARALAALLDKDRATAAELGEIAPLALAHRLPEQAALSDAELAKRIAEIVADCGAGRAVEPPSGEDDAFALMDNVDFPGSAAAGSMLFTYLKKKLKTATSAPKTPST